MKIDVYLSYDTIMPFPNLVQASFCLIYLKLLSNYNRNYLNIDQNWLNFNLKYFNLIKMGLIVKNWWNTIEIILIKITIIRIILIKNVEHAFLIKTSILKLIFFFEQKKYQKDTPFLKIPWSIVQYCCSIFS